MKKIRHMSILLDIISTYLDDYTKELTGREIARALRINHQTVFNHLKELRKENVINYNKKGRNNNYSLVLENFKTKIFLTQSEQKRSLDFLNKELEIIISEIQPFCESIIVFGSFADNTFDENSDLDLILLGKVDKVEIEKVRKRFSREINIETISFGDFKKKLNSKNHLAIEILKKHIFYGNVCKLVDILIDHYNK